MVSELFDPARWHDVPGFDFTDITYHRAVDQGTVRIAFDRPEVRNAFRPHTVDELYRALDHARQTPDVGCVLLTGNGPSPKDGGWAFCSGGDQRIRGQDGYQYAEGETAETHRPGTVGPAPHPRGPAADPVHAQGRDRRRARLGGRRRPQPARRLRPHDRQRASTPASSRPTPTSPASTAASARPTSPGRSARSSPARSSSSAATTRAEEAQQMGMVNAVGAPRRARGGRAGVGAPRSTPRARRRSGCSSSRST